MVQQQTYDLLHEAAAAAVTSGTATLETALFGVPQVVCYRGNALNQIARRLVKVPFISLVNLIAGKEVVRELIQNGLHPGAVASALLPLLSPGAAREKMLEDYRGLRELLGGPGAAGRAAKEMVEILRKAILNLIFTLI